MYLLQVRCTLKSVIASFVPTALIIKTLYDAHCYAASLQRTRGESNLSSERGAVFCWVRSGKYFPSCLSLNVTRDDETCYLFTMMSHNTRSTHWNTETSRHLEVCCGDRHQDVGSKSFHSYKLWGRASMDPTGSEWNLFQTHTSCYPNAVKENMIWTGVQKAVQSWHRSMGQYEALWTWQT